MEECKYCNKLITNYDKHKPQCKTYKLYHKNIIDNVLTKEFLNDEILIKNKTTCDISNELDINKKHINDKCKDYEIPYTETKKHLQRIKMILTKDFLIDEYINKDKSLKKISEEIDIATVTIKNKLKEYGIQLKQNINKIKKENSNIENKFTKDFLIEHYVNNGESVAYITKLVGLKKPHRVIKKLKEYDIPIRTLQEAKKQKHHIELAKETSYERHGVEFHLQKGSKFLEQSLKTIKEKYGDNIINIGQADEIKDKIKKTNLERYGAESVFTKGTRIRDKMAKDYYDKTGYLNPWSNPEVIKKCLDTKVKNVKNSIYYSKQSQELFWKIYDKLPKELQKHTYFAELNKEFGKYDKANNKYYFYDFVIFTDNIKICIEYNGNFYHANPKIYKENFLNKHLNLTAKEIWNKDKIKNDYIINLGFDFIMVWEDQEINNELIENILIRINSLLS